MTCKVFLCEHIENCIYERDYLISNQNTTSYNDNRRVVSNCKYLIAVK